MSIQGLDDIARKMGESAALHIEQTLFDSIRKGPNIIYFKIPEGPDNDALLICPGDCNHLGCNGCVCNGVHTAEECQGGCTIFTGKMMCPDCIPMDHTCATETLAMGGSKTYAQMWGHNDDQEPWDDEAEYD